LVPSIIVLHLIIKYSFQKKNNGCAVILRVWYSSVGIILLLLHQNSNSFEAIVFCMLCIISIIVGFVIQKKLYFIGGSIFLLIGVFLNTLNFWLNIPWWIYLLVGGALLIFFASKNEFNKSNKKDKKDNFISKLIKKIKAW
jgi:predicted membrane protein